MKNMFTLLLATSLLSPVSVWAWGRRGHSTIGEAAIYLIADEPGMETIKGHSFDIGYYCNIPDFLWKHPATYAAEKPQHFMDLEIFNREFAKHPEISQPFALSRKEFEAKFPDIKPDAGRAYWRIRELSEATEKVGEQLRAQKEQSGKEHQAAQEKWMVYAGINCHYVGDLSMPLHVSENYDGNLTDQKGIHGYFEDTCVDQMYPKLAAQVLATARAQWKGFVAKNKTKSTLELIEALSEKSNAQLKPLLAIDKASDRQQIAKTCAKYDKMITTQMAQSALVLAELYRRSLGWTFDDNRFYYFAGDLAYIPSGDIAVAAPGPAPASTPVIAPAPAK